MIGELLFGKVLRSIMPSITEVKVFPVGGGEPQKTTIPNNRTIKVDPYVIVDLGDKGAEVCEQVWWDYSSIPVNEIRRYARINGDEITVTPLGLK